MNKHHFNLFLASSIRYEKKKPVMVLFCIQGVIQWNLCFTTTPKILELLAICRQTPVVDPGFPVGGRGPRRGAWTPKAATFRKICMSKRKGPLGGAPGAPP